MIFDFVTVWVIYFLASFAANKYTTMATNKQIAVVSAVAATLAGLFVVIFINYVSL